MTTHHHTEQTEHASPRISIANKCLLSLLTLTVIGSVVLSIHTKQALNQQIQQDSNVNTHLHSNITQLELMNTTLSSRLDVINNTVSHALQERWYQNNDWLLLKARYALELATINAHWSDNTSSTIALLQQADSLLVNFHEQELYTVRQTIAKEIAQLQAIPTIDIVGLLAKLDAAQQSLMHIPVKNPFSLTKPVTSNTSEHKSASWREHLKNSLHQLGKLFIIRHHNEDVEPLLSPGYDAVLRENGLLSLQEAQWAVIQRHHDVYQLSLIQAIQTIKRAFDVNDKNTQALLEQLKDLQQTILDVQEKPKLGESLVLLNQWIESAPSRSVPAATSGEKQ